MVFNATVINISDISWWRSVLLVEETGVPGENPQPLASHSQTVSYNVVSRTPRHERDSKQFNISAVLYLYFKHVQGILCYMYDIHIM
jgi:hypothetical protein